MKQKEYEELMNLLKRAYDEEDERYWSLDKNDFRERNQSIGTTNGILLAVDVLNEFYCKHAELDWSVNDEESTK